MLYLNSALIEGLSRKHDIPFHDVRYTLMQFEIMSTHPEYLAAELLEQAITRARKGAEYRLAALLLFIKATRQEKVAVSTLEATEMLLVLMYGKAGVI